MPRKKYTKEYKELLRSYGIRQSMDGRSRWADNTVTLLSIFARRRGAAAGGLSRLFSCGMSMGSGRSLGRRLLAGTVSEVDAEGAEAELRKDADMRRAGAAGDGAGRGPREEHEGEAGGHQQEEEGTRFVHGHGRTFFLRTARG
ncbi:MAG: hypothetical protein SOV43_05795 [Selenomonadaceae bacterium]|nr:hypothetical protein [Selenomonadaceae bacterium]